MASGSTKRKHEEDWDFLDLTGDTPVYSRSEHSSQSNSRLKTGTFASHTGPKNPEAALTASLVSLEVIYPLKYSSWNMHPTRLGGHPSAPLYNQGATSMLPPASNAPPNYSMYSSTYTSSPAYCQYTSGGPGHFSSQTALSPPAKKQRKGKGKHVDGAEDAEEPEKRGAVMKKRCPKNILERVDRVISQRCVDHRELTGSD